MTWPSTVKSILEFISMVNFYHHFMPAAADIMQPLFHALTGNPKALHWEQKMTSAFKLAKEALASASNFLTPTWLPPLLLLLMLQVAVLSSLSMARDSHWLSSAGNTDPLSRNIVHLTMNSSLSTWKCDTSVTSLRIATSQLHRS